MFQINQEDENQIIEYQKILSLLGDQSFEDWYKLQKKEHDDLIELKNKIALLEKKLNEVPNNKYDLSHLRQDTQIVYGPIQDDEALLLTGFVKALRPKTIVEFGFSHGVSSWNFLKALDSDAKLFSYDIFKYNPSALAFNDTRFKFYLKSQTEFQHSDIDNRTIDIAFFDDGHIFNINKEAFKLLEDKMSPNGITIVHDTGLHSEKLESFEMCVCDFPNYCGAAHQTDERHFINWIIDNYQNWQVIHLHSFNIFRHGFTILQKKYKLSVDSQDRNICKI